MTIQKIERKANLSVPENTEKNTLVRLLRATGQIAEQMTGTSTTDHSYLEGLSLDQLRELDQFEGEILQSITKP